MKKIFKYLGALAMGAVLFTSCDLNDYPEFNDKDAFVAFNKASVSAVENAGTVNVPITLASVKGVSASVSVEAVDGSAKSGVNYVVETASVSFSPDAPTQNVVVKLINDDSFTGDLKFTLKLVASGELNTGAESVCTVTIVDKDHPLDPILGTYTCSGESYWTGPMKWDVTFKKDPADPYKIWIDNWAGDDSWAGDDTMIYGVVSEDLSTITIPFGQTSEYTYSNGEPLTYYGLSPAFSGLGAGEGNWTLVVSEDKSKMTESGPNGIWVLIEGAGNISVMLPGLELAR